MTKFLNSTTTFFLLLTLAAGRLFGQDATKTHQDSLIAVVDQYYRLNLKFFQVNAQPSDVDNIFNLFSDDFTYHHPKYGGTYTRETLYNGYVRNLKSGRNNGSIVDIKIINRISGLNAVVVEKRFVKKTGAGIEEGKPEMTLFEFRSGKIVRIFEYW